MAIEFYDVFTNTPCNHQDNFMVDSDGDVYEWVGDNYNTELRENMTVGWRVL
jgi:hypothetical protein